MGCSAGSALQKWRVALAILIATTATIAAAYHLDTTRMLALQHPQHITLVYIGADDCAPCQQWQRMAEPQFRASPEFARVSYRVVKSPTLFGVLEDEHWPEDLKPYRRELGENAGVPLWLVIADGKLVLQQSGVSQWRDAVVPSLDSLLR